MNGHKYYLKIEDPDGFFSCEFSNVSEMEITGVYRKESVQQNLLGDYLIDRVGAEKIVINARINLMDTTEMYRLRQARERISVLTTFDRGGIRTTKTMHLREFPEPTPFYSYPTVISEGNEEMDAVVQENIYYLTVDITLEEM